MVTAHSLINALYPTDDSLQRLLVISAPAAGLAQSIERLTAAREVAGSIPGAGPILRVLK